MILFLGSAQIFSNVVRIVGGILVARFVIPELLGTFNGIGIILGYLPVLQLGVMNGLNRELPYYFGKGEQEKAKGYASAAQFWEILLSLLAFSSLTFLSVFYLLKSNFLFAAGFFTYAIASIHHYYGLNYLQILFRTNQDFNKLSTITLIISIISFIGVLFVWKWKFYGLCIRNLFIIFTEIFLLWKWKPLNVKPRFNYINLKEISRVGLPIFIVGIIYSLWSTLQNTIVLKMGGAINFGLFQLALMIESSMGVMALAVAQVIYPKMAFEYGAGKKTRDLLNISIKPILVVNALLIPTIIITWFMIPYAVLYLIPKYMNGVEAARWTLLLLFVSVWEVNNNIFNVLKKQKDLLISILIGMLFYVISLILLENSFGFSLVHFPQAMFIGKVIQLAVSYFYIHKYI